MPHPSIGAALQDQGLLGILGLRSNILGFRIPREREAEGGPK